MLKSINPHNNLLTNEYQEYSNVEIEGYISEIDENFQKYRNTPFAQRADLMRLVASELRENKYSLAKLATLEMGKNINSAITEIEKCATVCDYYAKNAEIFLANEIIETEYKKSYIAYKPLGIVLAIMPWNFPYWQVFRFLAPTLMAGNTALLKHSSNVSGCALAIHEIISKIYPYKVFQTLLIGASRIKNLIQDTRIKAVTLTGSEAAGVSVGAACGEQIKKVVLELGGSDPFIVMPSSNIELAVSTAVSARTLNNGQSCIAAKRFIVHEDIYDLFIEKMRQEFAKLKIGNPILPSTEVGPIAKPEFLLELHSQVEQSIKQGATLVCGGYKIEDTELSGGNYYAPTILANVTNQMTCFKEETFGIVATITKAGSLDSAIRLANESKFGLGASAWTNKEDEAEQFINRIEAGSVFINSMVKSDARLPFGGIKSSGIGRELGSYGIKEFVNIKTIVVE